KFYTARHERRNGQERPSGGRAPSPSGCISRPSAVRSPALSTPVALRARVPHPNHRHHPHRQHLWRLVPVPRRLAERIRLYADRLLLQQIDAKGHVAECSFEPYWLRVVLHERGFEDPALLLRSHGHAVEIGAFLGPAERRQFAEQLQSVLARWRAT